MPALYKFTRCDDKEEIMLCDDTCPAARALFFSERTLIQLLLVPNAGLAALAAVQLELILRII